MKKILMCLGMFAVSAATYGKAVDENTAKTVAYNFYKPKANLQGLSDLSLAYTGTSVANGATVVDFYVFSTVSGQGFVMVSADDNVKPILGYSTESGFVTNKVNSSFQYLLDNYSKQIAFVIQKNTSAPASVAENWNNLKTASPTGRAARTTTVVTPMLRSLWDQENYYATPYTYNADCPYDSSAATPGKTLTGCVATAMAQVMKYWNWPDTGVGTNTYTQSPNPDGIPAQTANFAIAYHFDSMVTPSLTRANTYVAKLMYNAGVSVNMDYGTDAEDGSGAYVTIGATPHSVPTCAESALKANFRYPAEKGYQRRHFTSAEWVDSMLNEMNSGRPVIYAGDGSAGGHCWVMDGYDDDSMFHFNWGWSGSEDGYFTVNNLAPDADDTFNNDQEAIIRIMGDTAAVAADSAMHDTTHTTRTGVNTITTPAGNIRVFPNPAANTVNISFEGLAVKEIAITDIEGSEVRQITNAGAADNITIPVSDLPNGMYLLRLQTDQGVLTRKFVVSK